MFVCISLVTSVIAWRLHIVVNVVIVQLGVYWTIDRSYNRLCFGVHKICFMFGALQKKNDMGPRTRPKKNFQETNLNISKIFLIQII